MAHAGERSRQGEGDVALPSGRLVVGVLVGSGRVQDKPDRECEHTDDERVPGARELPRRAVVAVRPCAAARRRRAGRIGRRHRLLERAGLLVGERRQLGERTIGHQNWK